MLLVAQTAAVIDLQCVVIHGGVLEQSVIWIKHFFG